MGWVGESEKKVVVTPRTEQQASKLGTTHRKYTCSHVVDDRAQALG